MGVPARRQAAANPHNTYSSVKRIIGRPFSAVHADLRTLPYAVVRSFDGSAELWLSRTVRPHHCWVCLHRLSTLWWKSASRAGVV